MKAKPLLLLLVRLALCLFGMFAVPYLMTWVYINDISPDIHDRSIRADYVVLGGMLVGLAGLGFFFDLVGRVILKWSLLGWAIAAGFIYVASLLFWLIDSLMRYFVPDL